MSEQSSRQARIYTLAEARSALPVVKEHMGRIQHARQAILRLRPSAWAAIQKAASNGGSREAGELALHARQLEESVKVILGMGIQIKDLDHGIIDFLGKRQGHEVFLCWRFGEDDIDFWHETHTGFAGRRPIDGDVE
jgi:hypothetical protein